MFSNLIIFLDGIAPLIPLFYFFKFRKENAVRELFPLFFYFLFHFIFNFSADILAATRNQNYFIFQIHLPLSFFVLLLLFKQYTEAFFYTNSLFILGLLFYLLFIADSVFFDYKTFNSISYAGASLYVLIICLRYYYLTIRNDGSIDILKQTSFWIISGLFIYYCSSFIIFIAYKNFIATNNQLAGLAWRFHNIMLLIMCIIITKGIIVCQRYQTT